MLVNYLDSLLLVLDVQERLLATVFSPRTVIENNKRLLKSSLKFNVPVIFAEQTPDSLASTLNEIKEMVPEAKIFPKKHFSAWKNETIKKEIKSLNKKQIIITGLEAHICVLQTAFDLKEAGYDVFVVANAISSAFDYDYQEAINRMRASSINIVTSEMVRCEWLAGSQTEDFKDLRLELFKRTV
ncbi:MAG: isochorismatase family protein [Alphaproteobacteria bacterium]|nr:isochorismatase family protein [Alphaproteobacteria bacterium]